MGRTSFPERPEGLQLGLLPRRGGEPCTSIGRLAKNAAGEPLWAMVDWQNCGTMNPMCELAYFLCGSVSPDWRVRHEKEVLDAYYKAYFFYIVGETGRDRRRMHMRTLIMGLAYLVVPPQGRVNRPAGVPQFHDGYSSLQSFIPYQLLTLSLSPRLKPFSLEA